MIYIEIPYIVENDKVARASAQKEIQMLRFSDEAKTEILEAIYNRQPRGVTFQDNELEQVLLLENALSRLGFPYRQVKD